MVPKLCTEAFRGTMVNSLSVAGHFRFSREIQVGISLTSHKLPAQDSSHFQRENTLLSFQWHRMYVKSDIISIGKCF